MNCEMRAPVIGFELELTNRIRQIETAGLSRALVVVIKAGHYLLDVITDAIVVRQQSIPVNTGSRAQDRCVEAGPARGVKSKFVTQLIKKVLARLFPDSHRAIALDIAVPAYRTQPCTGFPHLPAQQHQIHNLLNVRHCVLVLCQAHGPAKDDAFGFDEDSRCIFDFDFRDSGLVKKVAPVSLTHGRGKTFETARTLLNEFAIEDPARTTL